MKRTRVIAGALVVLAAGESIWSTASRESGGRWNTCEITLKGRA